MSRSRDGVQPSWRRLGAAATIFVVVYALIVFVLFDAFSIRTVLSGIVALALVLTVMRTLVRR